MTPGQGIGTERPEDRRDRDRNGAPDQSEIDFAETSSVQPQPADAHTEAQGGEKSQPGSAAKQG